MLTLTTLIFLVFVGYTYVTSLSLCDTDDGYVEVDGLKVNNTFTCRDISPTSTVIWTLISFAQNYSLGTCTPEKVGQQPSCSASTIAPIASIFVIYRPFNDASYVTFNLTSLDNPKILGNQTLKCETIDQVSQGGNYVICPTDFIHRATNASCKVQFITNTNPWTVSGDCNITKIFSVRGRYRCRVSESEKSKAGTNLIANVTMSTTPTGSEFSGICTFKGSLPDDGAYSYRVRLVPGDVEFPFDFTGTNSIRRPFVSPNHNCPQHAQEGEDINCACFVSDYGEPSGTLQWNATGSTQLSLSKVQRELNGRLYVCRLTWNGTDVRAVNYTVIVIYRPVVLNYHLNSSDTTLTASESSSVTLSCQANGRPTPEMNLLNNLNRVAFSAPGGEITTADLKGSLTYNITNVQCEDSGNYTCTVVNDVGTDNKSLLLLVLCAPRLSTDDKTIPSIAFKDKEVRRQFNVTSYPTPKIEKITYLGSSSQKLPANETLSAECTSVERQPASVICTVTVHNMTSEKAVYYSITLINTLGQTDIVFEVKLGDDESQRDVSTTDGYTKALAAGIGIGVGVTVGVLVALLVPAVCCLRRRNWVLPCTHHIDRKTTDSVELPGDSDRSNEPSGHNTYDGLQLTDMGMKSAYSSLRGENQNKNLI